MLETSARLLELLSLLQLKRDWTSSELAARLGVSTRTVRTDIGKLRSIGYPVDARPGVAGGYRLAAGTAMPPLLLDDDEAVAVAVGLGAVATQRLGVEETSLTALAKLEQVLPARLRRRVETVREATSVVPGAEIVARPLGPRRGRRRRPRPRAAAVRIPKLGGGEEPRHTEPRRLVTWGLLWYLLAWDLDRDDWRVFRVDRMTPHAPTGARFRPRAIPADSAVEYVIRRVTQAAWTYRARVLVRAPAAEVAAKIPFPVDIEAVDESTCRVELGSDDPDRLALWLTQLDVDLEVIDGDELAVAFARLARRLHRAATTRRPPP